ncbi:hypothetical protein BCR42DRAFT_408689 [Absidia repens]|uniref:Uncharacterized protein n=1 Tax=Absidia repens TaxID=90262 RepID=A0A1X2IQ49_9FUNG|nr:hypothetical protein BCR42DRAFT_408689 [Absidia repens]
MEQLPTSFCHFSLSFVLRLDTVYDMTILPHLETTPKTYYKNYVTESPNYDLYPALSRRLGNGYVHQPSPPVRRQPKNTNFFSMGHLQPTTTIDRSNSTTMENSSIVTVSNQQFISTPSHVKDNQSSWDLYPSVLRNVENFGTNQMRQQLHAMETTTM